jgi:hypothetical protein
MSAGANAGEGGFIGLQLSRRRPGHGEAVRSLDLDPRQLRALEDIDGDGRNPAADLAVRAPDLGGGRALRAFLYEKALGLLRRLP